MKFIILFDYQAHLVPYCAWNTLVWVDYGIGLLFIDIIGIYEVE